MLAIVGSKLPEWSTGELHAFWNFYKSWGEGLKPASETSELRALESSSSLYDLCQAAARNGNGAHPAGVSAERRLSELKNGLRGALPTAKRGSGGFLFLAAGPNYEQKKKERDQSVEKVRDWMRRLVAVFGASGSAPA